MNKKCSKQKFVSKRTVKSLPCVRPILLGLADVLVYQDLISSDLMVQL